MKKYFRFNSSTGLISEWKSKGLSNKIIKPPDNSLAPIPGFKGDRKRFLIFNRDCLKQDEVYDRDKIVSIYMVYDLKSTLNYNPDFTLENCLFGGVIVTRNDGVNMYKYSGYGISFYGKGVFINLSFGNNAIIFGVDMTSSVHIDNKKTYFNFGKGSNTRLRRAFINCRKNVFNQF